MKLVFKLHVFFQTAKEQCLCQLGFFCVLDFHKQKCEKPESSLIYLDGKPITILNSDLFLSTLASFKTHLISVIPQRADSI
jgi:hypothetical protein